MAEIYALVTQLLDEVIDRRPETSRDFGRCMITTLGAAPAVTLCLVTFTFGLLP